MASKFMLEYKEKIAISRFFAALDLVDLLDKPQPTDRPQPKISSNVDFNNRIPLFGQQQRLVGPQT